MPAPYPQPTNITGFATWADYINLVTGNMFGVLVLIAATIIFYSILSLRFSTKTAVAGTGFTMSILAIVWRFAGMVSDLVMFTYVILAVVTILYLQFTKN